MRAVNAGGQGPASNGIAATPRTVPGAPTSVDAIAGGRFSPEEPDRYRPVVDSLLWGGDRYKLLADYDAYLAAQPEDILGVFARAVLSR